MTSTANLGLPLIEGSQAQKHVTHNEALRILDAAIQIAVRDMTRTAPPSSPAEGQRHVVAAGATGAWAGQAQAIATWQDGAWAFLAPSAGWCIWSVADDVMAVFDGTAWRDLRDLPVALDNVARVGINTAASAPNLLSVRSNAALLAAIDAAGGGSGDVRLQLSKETAAKTASVVFSDNYSGRAEFGLVGADAFKLKVSPDGAGWIEAFTIDQGTGNLALPRGLSLSGVVAPAPITANQNDYNPAGLGAAAVLQLSTDAARSISGLAGGAEGRALGLINVGSHPITLLDESPSSAAANRFALGGNLVVAGRQAALLRYDATAARWQGLAGGLALRADTAQSLTPAQQNQAQINAGLPAAIRGYLAGLTLSTAGSSSSFAVAPGVAADTGNTELMALGAACSKTSAAWAAGSGNGALDTGTIAANAWYAVHLIKRTDTGAVDVLISASVSSPTLPANYALARRIGFLRSNGAGQWVAFSQSGDEFLFASPIQETAGSAIPTSATLLAVTLPSGVVIHGKFRLTMSNTTGLANGALLQSPDEAPLVAGTGLVYSILTNGSYASAELSVRLNAAAQIRWSASAPGINSYLNTIGWIDRRGRDGW
jgi:hypothetical protein